MMFTFLRWSRASDTFIATYLRSVSFHLITNVFLAGWYLKYLNRDDVGHQGGGGGNHLFSPLVVREICFRTGKRDEFEGDGRHANDRGRFHGVMITLILPEGWLAGRDEHGPDMISRAVNEHGVSTLDLALWTPGIQSGAGRLGACGCMTLSAREDESVGGLSPEARVYKAGASFAPRGGIRITRRPRRAESASNAGLLPGYLYLPPQGPRLWD